MFAELSEQVESLTTFQQPHPESIAIAVETTKRYLPEARHRIRLHDLAERELEAVQNQLTSGNFEPQFKGTTNEERLQEIHRRMQQYEPIVQRLDAVLATIAFHDQGENTHLLTSSIERLCENPHNAGDTMLVDLNYYPALLATYSAGVAAFAANRHLSLAAVLNRPTYSDSFEGKRLPVISKLNPPTVFTDSRVVPLKNSRFGHAFRKSVHL